MILVSGLHGNITSSSITSLSRRVSFFSFHGRNFSFLFEYSFFFYLISKVSKWSFLLILSIERQKVLHYKGKKILLFRKEILKGKLGKMKYYCFKDSWKLNICLV